MCGGVLSVSKRMYRVLFVFFCVLLLLRFHGLRLGTDYPAVVLLRFARRDISLLVGVRER